MNEQQLADLFSEQLDRLLEREAIDLPPEAGDVPELLNCRTTCCTLTISSQRGHPGCFSEPTGEAGLDYQRRNNDYLGSIESLVYQYRRGCGHGRNRDRFSGRYHERFSFGSGLAATTPTKTFPSPHLF
jgi:hypothetical protein